MVAVLQPLNSEKYIAIDRAVVLVGRGTDCDAVITNSKKISRRHCCLVQVDQSYFVRDLGSMNGVWLNGTRVNREAELKAGDRLSIGDAEFLFHPNARIEQKSTESTPDDSSQDASDSPEDTGKTPTQPLRASDTPVDASKDSNDTTNAPDNDSGDFILSDSVMQVANEEEQPVTKEMGSINEPVIDDNQTAGDNSDDIIIFEEE